MKRSYVIALAGISAALAYVSIVLARFVDIMSVSMGVLAGICVMLPLTVKSITGAIFSYVSAGLLALFTMPEAAIPFALFYGPFAIIAYAVDFILLEKIKVQKWAKWLIGYIIKGIFYAGSMTALYFVMSMVGNMDFLLEGNMLWIGITLLVVIFFLYDLMVRLVFVNLRYIVTHKILKNHGGVVQNSDVKKEEQSCSLNEDDIFDDDVDNAIKPVEEDKPTETDVKQEKDIVKLDDNGVPDESSDRFKHFLENDEDDKDD